VQFLRSGRSRLAAKARGHAGAPSEALPWLSPPPGPWTVERAYHYCEDFARVHTRISGGFALRAAACGPCGRALRLLPRGRRLYRRAPVRRHRGEALDAWQEELHLCFHGEPRHPVFVALHDTIDKRGLTLPPSRICCRFSRRSRGHALCDVLLPCAPIPPVRPSRWGACCWGCSATTIRVRPLRRRDLHRDPAHQLLARRGRRRRP